VTGRADVARRVRADQPARPARHLALVGPTASGKSSLALALAQRCGDVEIISLDSMQVYRGMDVGTASPTAAERAAVRHHLIDVAEPWESWSVARTQAGVTRALDEIEQRGRRAVLVGGTGLYVRAVVDGFTLPGEDLAQRAELEAEAATDAGVARLRAELDAVDPAAAARIETANVRRLVRALEVVRATGRPFSGSGEGLDVYGPPRLDVALVGVWLPRAALARRIEARVAAMIADGLVEEVRDLLAADRPLSRTAAEAIGYREVAAALRGERSLADATTETVARTRRFARRQRVWFRRDPRITWVAAAAEPDALLGAVRARWDGTPLADAVG
jgi:tRNA dimethylallyltransferase